MRSAAPALFAVALLAGCGHSVAPRAPYDDPAGVPVPRAVTARYEIGRGLVVTWSATAGERVIVEGWIVERRATTETAFTPLTAVPTRDTTRVDIEVDDGVRYVYRVAAVTAAGVRSAAVETAPARADLVAPGPPGGVAAATAPGGVSVTFTPGGEPDLAFFEVRLVETGGGQPPVFRAAAGSPAAVGGLTSGATYAISVAAVDSAGRESEFSAPPATAVAGP